MTCTRAEARAICRRKFPEASVTPASFRGLPEPAVGDELYAGADLIEVEPGHFITPRVVRSLWRDAKAAGLAVAAKRGGA